MPVVIGQLEIIAAPQPKDADEQRPTENTGLTPLAIERLHAAAARRGYRRSAD